MVEGCRNDLGFGFERFWACDNEPPMLLNMPLGLSGLGYIGFRVLGLGLGFKGLGL